MNTSLISLALIAHLVLTLLVPAVRHRLRHGQWPTTLHRSADPVQRVFGLLLAGLAVAGLAWAVLLVTTSSAILGIWAWPLWASATGWVLLIAGTSLELAGQLAMGASFRIGIDDRPTELVTTGLFRWLRNPVFTGLLVALLGVVLVTPSAWTIVTYLWIASLIVIQVRLEEAHLLALHGERYDAYRRRVGRFLPLRNEQRRSSDDAEPAISMK